MTHLQTYADSFDGRQHDLADALGISQPYLSLLLNGRKKPSLELAIKIERLTKGAVPATSWVDDPQREPEPVTDNPASPTRHAWARSHEGG